MQEILVPEWLKTHHGPVPPVPADSMKVDLEHVVYIYALLDPDTSLIRYIGKSIRPKERLQNHMNERSFCHRSHWLQSLKARGLVPEMVILEEIKGECPWEEAERFWIARARSLGLPLTNNTNGGDGVEGLPEETRNRIASTWLGRKHKPESIEKMRAGRVGRKHSDESRRKLSIAQKGRVISWIDKVAQSMRKLDDDQIQSIQARLEKGERGKDLAAEFGVHRTTMSKIKLGTYKIGKRGKR